MARILIVDDDPTLLKLLSLFEAIHRRHPLLPVVMLTAHATIPDAVRALQRGVFGYITKPYHAQELMAEVVSFDWQSVVAHKARRTSSWRAGLRLAAMQWMASWGLAAAR